MQEISPHISYEESVRSNTAKRIGILNNPDPKQLQAMHEIAMAIFEPLRNHFKVPIYISSFFRSTALNKVVKGSRRSQHILGEAMDLDAHIFGYITNKDIFEYIKNNLEFDQLIWEYGDSTEPDWVHVSYTTRRPNRKQIIKI